MEQMKLEEIRKVQVEILKGVDRWCREHQVRYFLSNGTLLGAVRHQGYIPWDDDIDIILLRPDYERFLREFNLARTDALRVLHSSIDAAFPLAFAKVIHTGTVLQEDTDIPYTMGVNIDVFVLDAVGDDPANAEKLFRRAWLYRRILEAKHMLPQKRHKRRLTKRIAAALVKAAAAPVPVHWCTAGIDRVCASMRDQQDCKWLAKLCRNHFAPGEAMRSEWFAASVELPFEGELFQAPANWDAVLTAWFGDYHQLPPEEERKPHHRYKAYWA